jgi:hypothetical protein
VSVHAQAIPPRSQSSLTYVDYEIRGQRLRIPEKYLGGWQATGPTGRVIEASWIDFAFWVSDGAPSPVRGISVSTSWPNAPGRPSSGASDFVVAVSHAEYVPPGDEGKHVLPSTRLSNSLTYLLSEPDRIEDRAFDLIRYTSTRPSIHRIICATPAGADPQVALRIDWLESNWRDGRPPNPQWQAHLFSSDGFLVALRFREVGLNRWSDVVCQTLRLLRSWKEPKDGSPNDTRCGLALT